MPDRRINLILGLPMAARMKANKNNQITREDLRTIDFEDESDVLKNSFSWQHSPEGFKYWYAHYKNLRDAHKL